MRRSTAAAIPAHRKAAQRPARGDAAQPKGGSERLAVRGKAARDASNAKTGGQENASSSNRDAPIATFHKFFHIPHWHTEKHSKIKVFQVSPLDSKSRTSAAAASTAF
jgi:hypothetical protein